MFCIIGFQCHLNTNISYNYDNLFDNIKRFQQIGVDVYITELDVGMNLWGGDGRPRRKVSDVINEGDNVKVKVIGFDKRGKVRLSMKEVNQKTGKAL